MNVCRPVPLWIQFLCFEQVIQQDLALYNVAMRVLLDAVGADQGEDNGLLGSGFLDESVDFGGELGFVFFADGKGAVRVLHFAKVDGLVFAVDKQIHLCPVGAAGAAPCADHGLDTRYAQGLFDLVQMTETQHFECQSAPSVVQGAVDGCRPEMFVVVQVLVDEPEEKQGIRVD